MNSRRCVGIAIPSLAASIFLIWILSFVPSSSVWGYMSIDTPAPPTAEKPTVTYTSEAVPTKPESLRSARQGTPLALPNAVGIANGNFENGPDGSWLEYSLNGWDLILSSSALVVPPHSGEWAVWLGGDYDEVSYISQTVEVPSENTTLEFWEWVASEDLCGYDFAWVRVNSTNVYTVDLCWSTSTDGWVRRTVDLSGYSGQTVSLQFRVETDGSLNSNYFLDDIAFVAPVIPDHFVHLPLAMRNFWPGFFDDFSNPNSGWDSGDYPSVLFRYLSGEYQIYLKGSNGQFAITPDLTMPSDYRIEVDARKVSAGVCSYGLIFGTRWTADSWETYQVIVWPTDREFYINKRMLDGTWIVLQNWTYSSAINANYGTNRIRVDRVGTAIKVYINGTMVANLTDSSFTGPGRDAGIRAYSYWDAPVDVRFDNFRASQP